MININSLNLYFKKRVFHYTALFLFVLLSFLIYSSSFSQKSVYEGSLVVSQLSFTFIGGKLSPNELDGRNVSKERFDKAFLTKVDPLEKIIIRGVDSFILPSGEDTNGKFKKSEKINFNDIKNQLIIKPLRDDNTQLALSELNIQPKTDVKNLIYDPNNNRLYMLLEGFKKKSSGSLILDVGIQKLKIEINGKYELPKSKEDGEKLDLTLIPNNSKLNISLQNTVWLELDLKKNSGLPPKIEFGERFRVKKVQLYSRIGDIPDATTVSSIIEGQIQMPQTKKKLSLQSGQFLLSEAANLSNPEKSIPDESICIDNAQPNIYLIRNIETNSHGISFRIIGESKKLQSGFDPCFPVDWIKVSWLSKLFNPELHPVLLTFFTGTATSLLVWMITNIREYLPNSNNNQ